HQNATGKRLLYTVLDNRTPEVREVALINAYLVPAADVFIEPRPHPISMPLALERGCAPVDDGHYFLDDASVRSLTNRVPSMRALLHPAVGGEDFIRGKSRSLIRVSSPDALTDEERDVVAPIADRVSAYRKTSQKAATK